MYLEYWGLEKYPFDNTPDPELFFLSRSHEEGLARLTYTLERKKGCALLSGEVGSGKTTLARIFSQRIAERGSNVGTISNPCINPTEFLRDVSYKLGVSDPPGTKVEVLRALTERLSENNNDKRETLLIIDEAQLLPEDTLEEIRLLLNFQLHNQFMFTIFLLGQPEVRNRIKRARQFDQRVAIRHSLEPFSLSETGSYIVFREKKCGRSKSAFTRQAVEMIYKYSKGLPRLINNLCDLALLTGFGANEKRITSHLIREVLKDGAFL